MGHGVCDYLTKSNTLSIATNDLEVIKKEITNISNKLNVPPTELRGIGIQLSRLEKLSKSTSANALKKFFKPTEKLQILENKNTNATEPLLSVNKVIENNCKEIKNRPLTTLNNANSHKVEENNRNSPVLNVMQGITKTEPENKVSGRGRGKNSYSNQNISKAGKSRGRPKGSINKNSKKIVINNGNNLTNFFNLKSNEVRGNFINN